MRKRHGQILHHPRPVSSPTSPTMRTAIIIVPYFGDWPPWFPLYLRSCELNPELNWLVIGDAPPPEHVPANVTFLRMSLDSFFAKIGAQTGLGHRAFRLYKICDFKPVLGAAFAEEIAGHEFFGWGDVDLVYGRLAELVRPLLPAYDVISFSQDMLSNYTCLLRNEPRFLHLYRQVPRWRWKLHAPRYRAFDDMHFSPVALATGRVWNHECYTTPLVKGCLWLGGSPLHPRRWTWDRGEVTNDLDRQFQFAFFHFMVWKAGRRRHYHQDVRQWLPGEAGVSAGTLRRCQAYHFSENGIMAGKRLTRRHDLPFATDLNVPAGPRGATPLVQS